MKGMPCRGAMALLWALWAAASVATGAEGPKEQFQSVVYVRKAGAPAEMYARIRPQTLAMIYPEDFYKWGGKYCYSWFDSFYTAVDPKGQGTGKEDWVPDPNDPKEYVGTITLPLWKNWDKLLAAGILTGPRPAQFEDLCIVPREYAEALRDGAKLPDRIKVKGRTITYLCVANPAVRRMMVDLARFNAAHRYRHDVANGGFIDLDGGPWADYGEFCRTAFDAWLRANYTPGQVKQMIGVDAGRPIPVLPPKDMDANGRRTLERLYREYYWNVLSPEHARVQKEAMDAVLGAGKFHFNYHGDGYEWRVVGGYPTQMAFWGDWLDSYTTECARTPGAWRTSGLYAAPEAVLDARPNVYFNHRNAVVTNVYDYQYGAGRLWGEPVMVKSGYRGPAGFNTPAVSQLAVAEGLALLGNAGIYLSSEKPSEKYMRPSFVLPMTDFALAIAPQVRQMIPAARVGVVFSPADSWLFRGFNEPANDTQAYEVSQLCHRQHIPLQLVHLNLLEDTLARRPVDVLVFPWLRCVKDAQAAAIARFVQEGGKVLFIGECGTLTWEGLKRERNAFADLMPAGQAGFRDVGKGKTALLSGALDWGVEPSQRFQRALFTLLGHTPSCIAPDQAPLVLTNLTRNSDDSRFWLHLLNYDVDLAQTTPKPLRPAAGVRVVVPLPAGLTAQAVTLYRPEQGNLKLTTELGKEGCAVTVPELDIYALIAVETAPGERGGGSLMPVADAEEAARLVAKGFDGPPAVRALIAAPPAPPPAAAPKPRGFATRGKNLTAYAAGADGGPVRLQIQGNAGPDALAAWYSDGRRASPQAAGQADPTILTFAAPPAGGHLAISSPVGIFFTHQGGGCFEASARSPIELREKGDSPPLFFYVPKGCRSFNLFVNTRRGAGDGKTPPVYAVRLVVKDEAGGVRLEREGPLDGGYDNEGLKALPVQVPQEQAGRAWSLWFLDHPAKKGEWPLYFHLEGVPPVVAQSPAQLLIAKGDE